MHAYNYLKIFLLLTVFLSACSATDSEESTPLADISPAQDVYLLTDTTVITLNILNNADAPIFYGGCDKQQVEIENQNAVEEQFTTAYDCECICIVEIAPGETATFDYNLNAMGDKEPDTTTDRFFRVWPVLYETSAFQAPLKRDVLHVAPFQLQIPSP